ncbi:MAG: GNAT family N-acetyltransferase [Mycobacteriales bacterium]
MAVTIRTISADDALGYLRTIQGTFLQPPRPLQARVEFWLDRVRPDLSRAWGAFEAGTCVGTFRTLPFELTVPGARTVPADGVTAVTVAPTHRRRGLLTGLMAEGLRAAADRGDPVSILIAAEWRIYGRYGFGVATEDAVWEVDRARAALDPPLGVVEAVEIGELRKLAPPVYDAARWARPGGIDRPEPRWDLDLGLAHPDGEQPEWTGRAALHRDPAGEVDGYLRWHADDTWEGMLPTGTLHVDELVTTSPQAYADLWRFAIGVDLIARVRAADRPVDEPLPWLLADGRAARQVQRWDRLWLRVLDVPAALTGRGYPTAGRTVLEVVDPDGYAAGRFALDAGPDGADCRPTTRSADLTVPAAVLGAAYLGGTRLRRLAAAGLVDEHSPGAVDAADRLLAGDQVPFCPLHF